MPRARDKMRQVTTHYKFQIDNKSTQDSSVFLSLPHASKDQVPRSALGSLIYIFGANCVSKKCNSLYVNVTSFAGLDRLTDNDVKVSQTCIILYSCVSSLFKRKCWLWFDFRLGVSNWSSVALRWAYICKLNFLLITHPCMCSSLKVKQPVCITLIRKI